MPKLTKAANREILSGAKAPDFSGDFSARLVVSNPDIQLAEFVDRADQAMYRAKEKSKGRQPRPSAIGLNGHEEIAFLE
jgi:GGDEF domain-containing protein